MGNTSPVVIQDKNGKTTTVHRRIDKKSSSKRSVPAPSAPPAQAELSDEAVISLFDNRMKSKRYISIYKHNTAKNVQDALEFYRQDSPESFADALRYMTTGTKTGQEAVKADFSGVLSNVAYAHQNKDKGKSDWDAMLPSDISMQREFAYTWAAGNAVEEYGSPAIQLGEPEHEAYLDEIIRHCDNADAALHLIHGLEGDAVDDPAHWRGVAALVMTGNLPQNVYRSQPLPDGGPEFIAWAAHQDNLAEIIEVARERKTLHPESIQALIAQKRTTANSISSGIL